jgi:hypothetical protein
MRPIETTPSPLTFDVLPGATFADAFSIDVRAAAPDAIGAAQRAFASSPRWVAWLLALRNALVRPLGLKSSSAATARAADRIGFFPCLSQSPSRVLMGFDDRHLDFRVTVDAQQVGAGLQRITATTLVKPHNLFGRAYLALVMPFHKRIVPAMLARLASGV